MVARVEGARLKYRAVARIPCWLIMACNLMIMCSDKVFGILYLWMFGFTYIYYTDFRTFCKTFNLKMYEYPNKGYNMGYDL